MVYRVFVEKKEGLDNEAKGLLNEAKTLLGMERLENVRLFNRYDAENITEDLFRYAVKTVFSEPQLDTASASIQLPGAYVFAVEALPGQFDQRADSAAQCIQIISQGERPLIRTAKVYALYGALTDGDIREFKKYVINPVECREASLDVPETLAIRYDIPTEVATLTGFTKLSRDELADFIANYGLAMDLDDIVFCQSYFQKEDRDPTITEIRMIDTYWSDHCRHTTFGTILDHVTFEDALLQKTFTTDCISKKVKKNTGELPQYYIKDNHPAIIPRDIYQRVQEEMARRTSKRKILQKSGKTEQGKYSAKYALSERLVCGECGSPYKRCTWARNGVKRIVWRCVSRLEFGKKYCHNSPSMAEDKLHTAILTVLNRVVEASDGLQDELAETLRMVCTPEGGGNNLLELERELEALTAQQNALLDQALANMEDLTIAEQLKTLLEEKQNLQTRIDAAKKEAANRINEDSRMAEYATYLEEHLNGFPHYDDEVVRKMIERVTVVDAETIRVKFRYSDLEIEQSVC